MRIPLERLFGEPPITGPEITEVAWHPDGRSLTYLLKAEAEGPADLWSFELESGARTRLVEGKVVRDGEKQVALDGYQWLPSGGEVLVAAKDSLWRWDVAAGVLTKLAA